MSLNYNDIVKGTDAIVRMKSESATLPLGAEDEALLQGILTYIRSLQDAEIAKKGSLRPTVGIAVAQLGVPKRMLAVVVPNEKGIDEYAFVNLRTVPEFVQRAYPENGEDCLSVENEYEGIVPRAARITVRGYDSLQK